MRLKLLMVRLRGLVSLLRVKYVYSVREGSVYLY